MSTTGTPARLWPEDTVEYHIYSCSDSSQESLTRLAVECTHHVRLLTKGHIWHYGVFTLSVWAGKEAAQTIQSVSPHLWGATCYRDNIQDEWLIVYLLFMLSKRFPQLVISIADTDGQFLLIEAAHHLPKWLKPESSENRVFVHGGQLHIIPKPSSPAEVTAFPIATPTIEQAIQLIGNDAIPTVATSINKCIEERLQCFSTESLETLVHHTHCYLPCPAAHVISHDPQILSAAVHALCDRDPNDMVYCRQLKHFSPSSHSCVMTEVKFTRYLYAQLLNERFNTPRNGGFTVPPVGNPRHKACDLGMKLTCGLEILVGRISGVASGGNDDPVDGDPRWSKFLQSLKEKRYFQHELEGSKLYKQLLASAKEYFVASVQSESNEESRDPLTIAGKRIAHILQCVAYNEEEMKEKSEHLRPPDDDSWLQMGSDELDAMLHKAAGYIPKDLQQNIQNKEDKGSGGGELDLQSMVFGMKTFVDKISSHKGAEFPWSVDDSKAVDFNPETFVDTLKSMLNKADANDRDTDSDVIDGEDDISLSDSGEGVSGDEVTGNEGEGVPGDGEMEEIMAQMDQELAQTEVGKSFEKMKVSENSADEGITVKHVTFEDSRESKEPEQREDDFQPVDVDFNLVKNLLDSYTSQGGGAGPTSNILRSLGVHIPDHEQDSS